MTSDAGKGRRQRRIQDEEEWNKSYARTFGMLRFDWPKCNECKQPFIFEEQEPFAYCNCGTSEWGNDRPDNWMVRQRHHLRQTHVIIPENKSGSKA